jgi:hypothetical protein
MQFPFVKIPLITLVKDPQIMHIMNPCFIKKGYIYIKICFHSLVYQSNAFNKGGLEKIGPKYIRPNPFFKSQKIKGFSFRILRVFMHRF